MSNHPNLRADLALRDGYHSPQVDVSVRLNTNESPYAPPAGFTEALARSIGDLGLNRYPDRQAVLLRSAIATLDGVQPDQVVCANGSNEVLQATLLAFAGPSATVVVAEPTYALHSHIASLLGCTIVHLQRRSDFTIDVDAMIEAVNGSNASLAFVCSPNNPTGTLEPLESIQRLATETNAMIVVDEAYGQFAPRSVLDLDPGILERVIVVRTFSKTWALAGVRLGYAISSPSVIAGISQGLLPYHLSSLTQAAGLAALETAAAMERRIDAIVEGRGEIAAGLERLQVEQWPSAANFILFRPIERSADEVWQRLVDRGVLVRNCAGWPGLENCLRVTIGTPEENAKFLDELGAALT
ncbi:MAG: histidinol-phosphate transaminase [Actinomycetota bacterium]